MDRYRHAFICKLFWPTGVIPGDEEISKTALGCQRVEPSFQFVSYPVPCLGDNKGVCCHVDRKVSGANTQL